MYIKEELFEEPFYRSPLFDLYFGGLSLGVLDIETTGLDRDRSRVILGGLLVPEPSAAGADTDSGGDAAGKSGGVLRSRQFFAETPTEEGQVLAAYREAIRPLDVVITYNGDRFDLPFLERRFQRNGFGEGLPPLQAFDLYRVVNRYSKLRDILPNLKQKTVEGFLGLSADRTDEISGAESVALYNRYVKTGEQKLRHNILLHNGDDLVQLTRLLRILEKLDLHRIMSGVGFCIAVKDRRLMVRTLTLNAQSLSVSGQSRNVFMDYQNFGLSVEAQHHQADGLFSLTVPLICEQGYAFVDLEAVLHDFPSADFSSFEEDPLCESGYLIVRAPDGPRHREINLFFKKILTEILIQLC